MRIQGAEQIKGGDGHIVKYREDQFGALVIGRAEEAYDFDKTVVGYAARIAYFVRGPVPYLVMRDDAQVEHDRSGEYVGRYITYPGNTIVADGKSIIIRGQRGKSSARLMVFSGGKQVRVVEDDVARTTFSNRGEEYAYANYLPRASVTVNAVNPRFLSILVPFKDIKDLPEIAVDFDTRADIYEVTLKFETHSDTLLFNQTDPLLKRIVPGAG